MDDSSLFAPPAPRWTRLSRSFLVKKRIGSAIGWTAAVAGLVVSLVFLAPLSWAWVAGAIGVALIAWRQERLGRWFRRWGYAERSDDLCITSGLWWRSLTIVPYGRMQVVHVHAGPVDRLFGIATVELVTASIESHARIPGVARADAELLRDRLSTLGETRSAGL